MQVKVYCRGATGLMSFNDRVGDGETVEDVICGTVEHLEVNNVQFKPPVLLLIQGGNLGG